MGAVSNIVESVGDVVGSAVEAIGDAGSWIDDKVNEEIPGGWYTVGAATGAYFAPEIGAALGAETAGAEAAAAAAEGASGLATAAEAASPWGISAATPTAEFGAFNPATISAPGINTGALSGMEYLGGTGSLAAGTAGLTAEQLANATALGQVGTNAASGMGYLGGASSLPSGTAGITGVTSGGLSLTDAQNIAKAAKGLMGSTAPAQTTGGASGLAALVRGNQSPFNFGQQTPIQGTSTTNVQPTYLGQLANLLKG